MPRPAKSATLQLIQGNPNKKNTEELAARAEHEKKLKMRSDNIKPPTWLDKVGKKNSNELLLYWLRSRSSRKRTSACWPPTATPTLSIFLYQK